MPLVVGILHQAYSFRDDPSPNSLATKNSLQLLQQAFLFFFFLPALFGPLNDNLEWHCLGLWRRVKKFLWSWQRARRLDKRHQYSTNQRVWENMKKELFIQVKDTHTKKKRMGTNRPDGIQLFFFLSFSFQSNKKSAFNTELDDNDEIWGNERQHKDHYIRTEFVVQNTDMCETDCIWWTLSLQFRLFFHSSLKA